jgi:hypothetical protein
MYMFPWGDAWANTLGLDSTSTHKAEYWEKLHCNAFLKMQARFADGHAYAPAENSYCCMGGESAWTSGVACMAKWLKVNWSKFNRSNDNMGSRAHGTSILGCDLAQTDNGGYGAGQMYLTRFTAVKSFIATGMSVCAYSAGTGKLSCAIYADNNGSVGPLQAGCNEITNPAAGWNDLILSSSLPITRGTKYWLGYWSNAAGFNARHGKAGGLGSGIACFKAQSYGAWPSALAGLSLKQARASIYAWGSGSGTPAIAQGSLRSAVADGCNQITILRERGNAWRIAAKGSYHVNILTVSGRTIWSASGKGDAAYDLNENVRAKDLVLVYIRDMDGARLLRLPKY